MGLFDSLFGSRRKKVRKKRSTKAGRKDNPAAPSDSDGASGPPARSLPALDKAAAEAINRARLEGLDVDSSGFRAAVTNVGWKGNRIHSAYQTYLSDACTRAAWERAQRPGPRRVLHGWRFTVTDDSDSHPTHLALDGVVASFDDPIWEALRPPLDWECRCMLESVTHDDLEAESKQLQRVGSLYLPKRLVPGESLKQALAAITRFGDTSPPWED
jgi:SPP1 gp7 family putative phage head morphogenesis protein